jgi:peptidoglycan L-alanyl-D-glutamate endopeptidase CwlK
MTLRNLDNLHPHVKKLAKELILSCKKQGVPIYVCRTFVTLEEQENIYAQGRTIPGAILTHFKPGYSLHNYGLAFDILCTKNCETPWDENTAYRIIGGIGKDIGLTWGGDKKIHSVTHFEWSGGLSIKDLLLGKIPPRMRFL